MTTASTFFTEAEKAAIAESIAGVEKRTTGEVAVLVTEASDSYPEAPILAGLCLGTPLALLLTDLFRHDSLWFFLPTALLAALAIGLISRRFPPLMRLFITKERMEEEVAQRALQAFYEKGLYRTREATGVLFFLSLLERRAWVLADRGISMKISREELTAYVSGVTEGVRQGEAAAALCREIERVGELLARHFPPKEDDRNELPDTVEVV